MFSLEISLSNNIFVISTFALISPIISIPLLKENLSNAVTKYNYVVVNDDLEEAINKVEAIIKAEKCRVDRIEEVYLDTKEEEIHELLMDKDFENDLLSTKIN